MKHPYERRGADIETRHHLLYPKPNWDATPMGRKVRNLGAYMVRGVPRAGHDYLHLAIDRVPAPHNGVLDAMHDIGLTYNGIPDDQERLDHMLDDMVGFAHRAIRPEQAHQMWEVSSNIAGQLAIVEFFKGVRRYE